MHKHLKLCDKMYANAVTLPGVVSRHREILECMGYRGLDGSGLGRAGLPLSLIHI